MWWYGDVNPRGSAGYGQAFIDGVNGDGVASRSSI
jgi:dipeptidyl aminopeptidase/acylaminoacyl peptidase